MSDGQEIEKPKKLIEVDYSYDNIVKNPVLKAIAETDRTLIDLMEMTYKKTLDAARDKKEINETLKDIPAYQSSIFIGRLVQRSQEIDDIIKLQNLIIRNLRGCIGEMYKILMEQYGVFKHESKEEKIIDYRDYLVGLLDNETTKEYVSVILEEFDKDPSTISDKRKFENACGNIYTKKDNKGKIIIGKIMRMEY